MSVFRKAKEYFRHPLYRWMRLTDIYLLDVERLAGLDKAKEYFNVATLDKIQDRKQHIDRYAQRISIFNYVILVALVMTVYDLDINFSVVGINFSKLDNIRELLLLISSFMSGLSAVSVVVGHTMSRLIERLLPKIIPEKYNRLFEFAYLDPFPLYGKIILPNLKIFDRYINIRYINIVLPIVLIFYLIILAFAVAFFMAVVHIIVIIDIWSNPSLPLWINRLIIFFTLATDLFIILSMIFVHIMPIRYVNYSILRELRETKEKNYLAYLELMTRISKKKSRK